MGKTRMSQADAERYEILKRENKALKKQIARLQKQLSRIDLDAYSNLQEIVEAAEKEDKQLHQKSKRDALIEKWLCHGCGEGYLRLIIVNRIDGIYYMRRCKECGKKTKLQRFKEGIEGITD